MPRSTRSIPARSIPSDEVVLAGPVSYLRSNLTDGVKQIPLKFTGRAGA